MSKRISFEHQLVKFGLVHVTFPQICPVCLDDATTYTNMTLGSGWNDDMAINYHPYELRLKATRMRSRGFRIIRIPVCDEHTYSSDEYCRLRLFCIFGTVIIALLAWMAFGVIRLSTETGDPIPMWTVLILIMFGLAVFFTGLSFRPSQIERAVRVVYFDLEAQEAYVDFKSIPYRNLFLEENPQAELVDEIITSSS